jgi:hypothetical protein
MRYLWKGTKEGFGVHLPRIREGMVIDDVECVFAPREGKTVRPPDVW